MAHRHPDTANTVGTPPTHFDSDMPGPGRGPDAAALQNAPLGGLRISTHVAFGRAACVCPGLNLCRHGPVVLTIRLAISESQYPAPWRGAAEAFLRWMSATHTHLLPRD